jgi:hypothetical protein
VVPSDWATCHLVIGLSVTNTVSTVSMPHHRRTTQSAATSASIQPSHLPRHLSYNHVSCHVTSILHSHPATSASIQPNCHLYYHVSACHWATSCTDCHVSSVQCHVSNPYRCQLSPKMSNLSDTCHLLVMPHQHDDIIMTSPVTYC